jgi:large subunit ribosomal protein L10
MAHVAQWKKDEVKEINKLINEYPVIGIVDLGAVPGKQIQKIRTSVRGDTLLKMSRKRLMVRALKKASKEGVGGLSEYLKGQPGFLFSKTNPFRIYKTLEKNKTKAPAKPNAIALSDISVSKGETPFPPGPILSELQQAGIPAAIQSGKVVIKQDKVIVKAGEKITPAVANALARLEIEPLEIKLDLLAAYERGVIYSPDILAVDSQKILSDIVTAHQEAVNLSINSAYLTKETAAFGISQAAAEARNLAINAAVFSKEVIETIISNAQAKAQAIEFLTKEKVAEKTKELEATTPKIEPVPKESKPAPKKKEAAIPITSIKGLGTKTAEKLEGAGIKTVQNLVKTDIVKLSKDTKIKEETLKKYLSEAKKLMEVK